MDETGLEQVWKVGELATEAGLTVRTLHHYDHIGLVRPAGRTNTGHRLYTGGRGSSARNPAVASNGR
jgi:hypothetical protein